MLPRRDGPLPLEAVRDLRGLVRALCLATPKAEVMKRRKLRHIGEELTQALDLALTSRPDTVGHRAAWMRAEDAARALGDVVELLDLARPVVTAAQRAVLRHGAG
jgi:hypothetical protein